MHFSPFGQPSACCVRVTATNTAPQRTQRRRLTHFQRRTCRPGWRRRSRRISRLERRTRTRRVTLRQRRVATPTVPFAPPPFGTFAFHTSLPVSAFREYTQPRLVATYTQPRVSTGVPVMSPSPPAFAVEKVHVGDSSGASAAAIVFSLFWK